ncbi:MAG: hypothetical protein IPM53_06685 [Anaerolineaceae bacterium]|nr:hypothetical protein [Anaerolineaceae bacterium]
MVKEVIYMFISQKKGKRFLLGWLVLFIISATLPSCDQSGPQQPETSVAVIETVSPPAATAVASAAPIETPISPTGTQETLTSDERLATRRAFREATLVAAMTLTGTPGAEGSAPPRGGATVTATFEPTVPVDPEAMVPLMDMGESTYFGFEGGLYPGGQNEMPAAHAAEGLRRALMIQPLDVEGRPNGGGNYILLSVGLSNTGMEFCRGLGVGHDYLTPCNPYSFMGQSAADTAVNHSELVILSGARGGQVGTTWDSPDENNYDRIRDELLGPLGHSEQQVQVIWLKVVNPAGDRPTLPSPDADAFELAATLADIVRSLKVRYPNLQQVFISSRIYAGYADERGEERHPEPYAYESGFAVKWLIEAQINQMESGEINSLTGDLNYNTVAPWLAWGPYLWADGTNPRSDGLIWPESDLAEDGVHPDPSGQTKVAEMLLAFFKSSPVTRCWYLAAGTCE